MISHEKKSKPLAFESSVLKLNKKLLKNISSVEKFREKCDTKYAQEKLKFLSLASNLLSEDTNHNIVTEFN